MSMQVGDKVWKILCFTCAIHLWRITVYLYLMNIIYVICIPQYTKLSYKKLRKTKGYIMVTPSFSLTKNNQGVCNGHEILSCHTTILGVDHTSPYNPLLSNYASDHMVNSYGLTFLFLWGLDCGHVEKYWEYFDLSPPPITHKRIHDARPFEEINHI